VREVYCSKMPGVRDMAGLAAAVALLALSALAGEGGRPAVRARDLSKDELLNQLKTRQAQMALDQAKAEMDHAKAEFEETRRLFAERIYTIDKLNRARQAYERAVLSHAQAKIDLERTRLDFLKDATLITVVDARKYRGDEGQVMASVTLRNDSDMGKARVVMGEESSVSDDELASLLKVDNVIVTLKGTGPSSSAIVGDPFQQIVPELKLGQEASLEYRLLERGADAVTISVEFLETSKGYTVFLKKEALQDLPTISSTQYAQQGELGSKIAYDLELERLAKTEQSFALVVLNLPPEITFAFLDPSSGARITQLKFTAEISRQNLRFEVSIPERLDQGLVDSSIAFYIVVTKREEQRSIYDLKKRYEGGSIPAEEIARLKGNRAELILIPSGTGKLDVILGNSFKEVQQGEPVDFKFNLMNSGTLALRRAAPELELPVDWEGELTPREVELIPPGQKTAFAVSVRPPEGVPVGEYAITIKCEGHSGIETVDAAEKDFTVRIAPKGSITGTAVLVAILVGLVLAIAVASVKISRR
jgi:hypothetical protein